MNAIRGLDSGDFVVRRKRKRHPVYCEELAFSKAQQCAVLSGQPHIPYTGTGTLYPSGAFTSDDQDYQQASLETQVELGTAPSGSGSTGLMVLKHHMSAIVKRPKTYKARFVKRVGQENGPITEHGTECLQLRSRQIQRPVFNCRPSASPGSSSIPRTRTSHRQPLPKRRKQKKNRLAAKLLNAVVMTSGEPNEDLMLSVTDDGNLRTALRMVPQPRSPIELKPRKWSLVDPRKVMTPFCAPTFRTIGEKRMTTETPISYGHLASQQLAAARRFTTGDPETLLEPQELSSPCTRRSQRILEKKVAVKSPPQLELVSSSSCKKKNIRRSRRARQESKTQASTANIVSGHAPPAEFYHGNGRRPLEMASIQVGSRTGRRRGDLDAGKEQPSNFVNPCTSISSLRNRRAYNTVDVRNETRLSSPSRCSMLGSAVSEFSSVHAEQSPITSPSRVQVQQEEPDHIFTERSWRQSHSSRS